MVQHTVPDRNFDRCRPLAPDYPEQTAKHLLAGVSKSPRFRCNPLDYRPNVAQTTTALRVSYIAGALSSLNTCRDGRNDTALTCGSQFGPDAARGMSKAVAHKNVIVIGVFLVDAFAQGVLTELLLTISAGIHRGTIWCSAEAVFNWTHFR